VLAKWSRIWFASTAFCVGAGVLISVFTAANNSAGHFRTPTERAFNTFAFFTIQSNLIVGVTTALLALKPSLSGIVFATARLTGVVTSSQAVRWSLLFPVCWLIFTLIRGAVVNWYPYPFIDVTKIGYGGAILNCVWVSLLLLGLAAGATAVDRRLRPRST
jgi:hypothetical protein